MHMKFLPHGGGSGADAVNYLLAEKDHKGQPRDEIVVSSDLSPLEFAELVDSLTFKKRYTSGVISFSPDDEPSPEQRKEVEEAVDNALKAGMGDRVATFHVWHKDENGWHMHTLTANVDLATGKHYNPAPPGWQSLYDPLRDYYNAKYGWKSPDIDANPENARDVRPSWIELKSLREGMTLGLEDPAKAMSEYIKGLVVDGQITDRASMLEHLKGEGFEIPRAGKDYITVQHPDIPAKNNKVRLRGALFDEQFDAKRIIEEERNGATSAVARRAKRTNSRDAERFNKRHQKRLESRVKENQRRYGGLSERLDNRNRPGSETQPEKNAADSLDRLGDDVDQLGDCRSDDDLDDGINANNSDSDKRSDARLREELRRKAVRSDRSEGAEVQEQLSHHSEYKQKLTATFFINAVTYRDMRYVDTNKRQILFNDGGRLHVGENKLTAINMSDQAAADRIIKGAIADNWKGIKLNGSDDFITLAMRTALDSGLSVTAKDEHQAKILKEVTKQFNQQQEQIKYERIRKQRPKSIPAYRKTFKSGSIRSAKLRNPRHGLHSLSKLNMDESASKRGFKVLLQTNARVNLLTRGSDSVSRVRGSLDGSGGLESGRQQPDTIGESAFRTVEEANQLNQHINETDRKIRERSASNAQRHRDITSRSNLLKNLQDLTYKSVKHQVNAMDCQSYTVGIRDEDTGQFMHKHYTKDQLLNQGTVGYLRAMNARGNHIYIMPGQRENHGLILLDDIDKTTVEQMINDGRNPVLAIETSEKNYQVWLRVGHAVDKESRLEVSRMLAQEYGADPGSIGSEHFGRLAGFTNRKMDHITEHGFPYSKIDFDIDKKAEKRFVTPQLSMDLQQAYQRIENNEEKAIKTKRLREELAKRHAPLMAHDRSQLMEEAPDEIYYRQYQELKDEYGNNFDKSRADFMIAKELVKQYDQTVEQVRNTILRCSPDCYDRKNNPEDYAVRTAEAAHNAVYRERDENKDELKSGPGLMKPKI